MLLEMHNYIKKVYYEDDDIIVTLEELDGLLLAHVAIEHSSKKVLKRILKVWEEIKRAAYWQGYENIYTYTKEGRMLKFFKDWKKYGTCQYKGETYEVVGWALN